MKYKDKKIVLIIPNTSWFGKRQWFEVNQASLIITGILKEYNFEILDANGMSYTFEECETKLRKINPDILLITSLSTEYYQMYHKSALIVKTVNPKCITVMGGVYPTVLPYDVIEDTNIDYALLGYAENRLDNFIDLLIENKSEEIKEFDGLIYKSQDNEIIYNPINSFIGDCANLVDPDYSKTDLEPYLNKIYKYNVQYAFDSGLATILTSYGCPYNCTFCAGKTVTGRKIAYRTVESVIKEIEFFVYEKGIKNFVFLDDCLLFNRERIEKILNTIIDNKYDIKWKTLNLSLWHIDDDLLKLMKKSGCVQVVVSVESGSERVLKEIIKKPLDKNKVKPIVDKCKELEIEIVSNFVIGFPGESWEEIRESFSFAEECDFDYSSFYIATVLPKTEMYEICKRDNLLPDDFSFKDPKYFGFGESFVKSNEFTSFELKILRSFEWDRINFSTEDKKIKIAKMFNVTLEELEEHRRNTRMNSGKYFSKE